jgi:adenylosuccinate synthase
MPTELFDSVGEHLAVKGQEVGTTTGRGRRCGWFDAVAVRHAIEVNSISGICLTKLDVLDGLEEVKMCVAYELPNGEVVDYLPSGDDFCDAKPVYETMPGWSETTFGMTSLDEMPQAAKEYVHRLGELVGAPIDIVSTGPDREQTIVISTPFGVD